MQIDWLTVAAQIVNFLVLVWLLKRFLYAPITKAMRRRERRIEDRLADAREAREQADARAEDLKRREAELDERRERILAEAREEAESLRARLEDEIRGEMEERREAWRAHLAEERDAFVASLRRRAGRRVLEVAGRLVSDYADADLADRATERLLERLKALDADTREDVADAAARAEGPAVVETGAELESAAKGRVTRALRETLASEIEVEYREDPALVLGARLTVGDYTAEWSAARHLDRLQTELEEIVDAETRRRGPRREGGGEGADEDAGEGAPETAAEEDRARA